MVTRQAGQLSKVACESDKMDILWPIVLKRYWKRDCANNLLPCHGNQTAFGCIFWCLISVQPIAWDASN